METITLDKRFFESTRGQIVTLLRGAPCTVEDLAEKVHKDIAAKLTHARIWGSSVHEGQSVGREHVLADRDLVELHSA